ncbi:tetratricopeptide repeat protein [Haliangium ochraceum]|uniref:TPR repeat-containing protein n=1 Tax=Haliangium ochraceum (strain DSM 14365 / JCM 11303 / SMP-2) TaxID=502025 RepID=D0LZ54_HALO1|nr:tetratricopeptide repeat protein [Haliangium ochraceum]ACY16316.1 TPR repeat-containing protein [Haliangium ochraceum DSM 14365]
MAEFQPYLRILDTDPTDTHALQALEAAIGENHQGTASADILSALAESRSVLRERGAVDTALRLLELALRVVGDDAAHAGQRADLLLERGRIYVEDLLDDAAAEESFRQVLALREGDESASESLAQLEMERENWAKFVEKNLSEAESATDRKLVTHMYLSAAEFYGRYQPGAEEFERYLRKALEVDPENHGAARLLVRALRTEERWEDLLAFLDERAEQVGKDERIQALLDLGEIANEKLGHTEVAENNMKKVLAMDPVHPRALRLLSDLYERLEDWSALVMLYTGALKSRRGRGSDFEMGMLLQVAMLHWRRLDNLDAAEEYFRQILKAQPAHPAALSFYRAYYAARGEGAKLLQILRQAQKSLPRSSGEGGPEAERWRELAVEVAELAENDLGNPEKAIDAWKSILRADADAADARVALLRLYRKTEKWNALLDLMKDEIERLPEDDLAGRVSRLMEVVEIYRDRLKLDVMVINTYKAILDLDPGNLRAVDDLASKYTELGRWKDLISVLSRKSEMPEVPRAQRAEILREMARLWSERFGNFAQAIKPLEALVDLMPDDAAAFAQLKDIYSRRRQWRQLIDLLGREALGRPPESRREVLTEMARLAAERVGDSKLSVELWNRVLELPAPPAPAPADSEGEGEGEDEDGQADENAAAEGAQAGEGEALAALAHLYEREKRYPALAEVYHRQWRLAEDETEAVGLLEKLGSLLADRMDAPALAAQTFRQLLTLRPRHNRALRTLREIYATEGNYAELESLYAELGQWTELVDAFHTIADRISDEGDKLYLFERSAAIAAEHFDKPDRVARAYERVLAVAPEHLEAARALVPIYEATEKWARLLGTYEVLLGHAADDDERLDLELKIRDLCEARLGSKALAFQWAARAYRLAPGREDLRADLIRLGADADQWNEVAEILDARARDRATGTDEKLALLRELGRMAAVRLHEPERARAYQREVLVLSPDDPEAMDALEELATQLSDWPDLLTVQRRRVALADADDAKIALLFKIAFVEEERLEDLDAAVATYESLLALVPESQRAMRALARLQEERGDWEGLVDALGRELSHSDDTDTKVALLMRIGGLYERNLERPSEALGAYCEALSVAPGRGQIHSALERFLSPPSATATAAAAEEASEAAAASATTDEETSLSGDVGESDSPDDGSGESDAADASASEGAAETEGAGETAGDETSGDEAAADADAETGDESEADDEVTTERSPVAAAPARPRVSEAEQYRVAELLLPVYEQSGDVVRIARAVEVLRAGTPDEDEALAYDRRLRDLYGDRRGDETRAYEAALRVLRRAPEDGANRAALLTHSAVLGRDEELARHFENVLAGAEGYELPFDPKAQRGLAVELAVLYEQRLEDNERAERAWQTVLELAADQGVVESRAYDALDRIYRTAGRWRDLRDLLLRREEVTLDDAARKDIVLAICELEEGVLEDRDGAIAAYLRVLDIDPSLDRAYRSLERLLARAERHFELEELLAREGEYAGDATRVELLFRRAELRAQHLGDTLGAVPLLEEVVLHRPGHRAARTLLESLLPEPELRLSVARILEPLYEQDRRWLELCRVLRAQREFSATPYEAAELLARVAAVEEDEMGRPTEAFNTWVEILALAPGDQGARASLRRLGTAQNRWADVAAAYEMALEKADLTDVALAIELLTELAEIYDQRFTERDRAISAYRRLLDLDLGSPDTAAMAARALDRLYTGESRWDDLVEILRRQADWADDIEERKRILARVARVSEEAQEDVEAAILTWREVLSEDPEDGDALDALERLYQQESRAMELIEILRRRVELAEDAGERKAHLWRIAVLFEHAIEDRIEAITAHLEVLDHVPEDPETLMELGRLYRAEERYADLLDVLERRLAQSEEPGERIALTCEAAELLATQLGREAEALERYARVLEDDPDHGEALAAVEKLTAGPELLMRGAEILRPIYERAGARDDVAGPEQAQAPDGAHSKLAALLLRVVEATLDPREQLRALREVARIREQRLGDPSGAFEVAVRALRVGVAEPEMPELLDEVERLGSELERPSDLIEIYQEIAPDVLDGEQARRLHLDIADLARAVHEDPSLARSYYQRVLDDQPEDSRAMVALESIYRETDEHEALYDILVRKADMLADDLDARSAALAEAARLCAEALGRPEDAILAWEQVLELTPDSREATVALERLYEAAERHHDLVDLLERRLGFAFTVEEAVALRYRLGDLCEHKLYDPDTALENYSAALGGDPGHVRATEALERFLDDPGLRARAAEVLEPIYVAQQDWVKLVRIYEIKLDSAEDADERLALTRYIARLHEEQLEDLEGAMHWCGRVFREIPSDVDIREQLARLASILDRWEELSHIFQAYLDDEPGEPPELASVARALGDIYERRLDEIERAQAAYRRVLQVRPDDLDTFERLRDMLTRAERWYALIEVYDEAIARAPIDESGDRRRIELFLRMAWVYEEHLHDAEQAINSYRSVRDIDPGQPTALAEIDRLYQAEAMWFELAELLAQRVAMAEAEDDVHAAVDLRIRLAEVLGRRLEDVASAIDQYEQVLRASEGWERALPPLERLVLHEDYRARIAELLEPVYRANDWWKKLVVILDTQVGYVDDPDRRVAMLREIAHIHETRGGDERLALEALSRAWRENVRDSDALAELTALAAKLGAWETLAETLAAGVAEEFDPDLLALVWSRIAEIHEERRGEPARAIEAWRKVLEVRDDDDAALSALDRLLLMEARYEELVRVVEKRANLAQDEGTRRVFLHRIAALYEEDLEQRGEAIAAYKNVLTEAPGDPVALDALERLYREESDWHELVAVLQQKIEQAQERTQRRELRLAAADVYERQLEDIYEAMAMLRAILDPEDGDPEDGEALARLDVLYQSESAWPDLIDILDRRAALESEPIKRAELAFRGAQVAETELLERDDAIERYAALLAYAPGHGGTRAALDALAQREETAERASAVLERLYEDEQNYDALAALYEQRLSMPTPNPERRFELYRMLAQVCEERLGDLDRAFEVWALALSEYSSSEEVQDHLERLAASRGAWEDLVALLEQRLAELLDAELEYAYALKLASLYEDALGDLEGAAEKYRRALDVAADEREPLAALDRIYGRSERYEELAEVLAREAEATLDEGEQCQFLFRLGDLREVRLRDLPGAVNAYRDVLERIPQHSAARGALERLLHSAESVRADIIRILEPLYEQEGDFARLADLLAAKLGTTGVHFERAQIYSRIAELAENQLGDPVRALDAAGGWLAEDPQSQQALAELARLAEAVDRFGEMAARLSGIVESADDPDIQRALLFQMGTIELERLRDDAAAEASFKRCLEISPEFTEALDALQRIYRERGGEGDRARLADVLGRMAEITYEPENKRRYLVEVAELRGELGELDAAVEAWREVLALDEGDRDALARLAIIHEQRGDWYALIDILGQSARYAANSDEERRFRSRIAQLQSDTLEDLDAAVEAWQSVLDVAPDAEDALTALEGIHTRREDWGAVQDTMARRLDLLDAPADRVAVLHRLADLAADKRDANEDAIVYLFQALDLDDTHLPTYEKLDELLGKAERWHDLVDLLERAAGVYARLAGMGAAGQPQRKEIDCLARAADIWEGPLANPDAAAEILEKILAREPAYVPALTRLSKIYESAGDWDRCAEVLDRALALGPTGRDAAELYFRMGEVAREQSGDAAAAMSRWQQALASDPSYLPAIASIEAAAREAEDWPVVADMLTRRHNQVQKPAEQRELALALVDILRKKLGQRAQAIPLLEGLVSEGEDDPEVLRPLADLYCAAQQHDRAVPIYERLADAAKKARQLRDVAVYRQRLASILEARGQMDEALAAYEEAFRVNPTDIATMAGLGRIYLAREAWEKARRVYRSMVLQNLDEDAGISKAQVYGNLGRIHVALGEPRKAKGMFQRGLELEPQNPELLQGLESLSE